MSVPPPFHLKSSTKKLFTCKYFFLSFFWSVHAKSFPSTCYFCWRSRRMSLRKVQLCMKERRDEASKKSWTQKIFSRHDFKCCFFKQKRRSREREREWYSVERAVVYARVLSSYPVLTASNQPGSKADLACSSIREKSYFPSLYFYYFFNGACTTWDTLETEFNVHCCRNVPWVA